MDEIEYILDRMKKDVEEVLYDNPIAVIEFLRMYKREIAEYLMDEKDMDEFQAYEEAGRILEDAFERYFAMEMPGMLDGVYGVGCTGRYPLHPYDVNVVLEWNPEEYEDEYEIIEG
ncbi:MAG: hypothetical protein J7K83_00155 [Candidatus Aenigmarchaeota archaeon]|nr:hypothetical protein [Candidatus Aenigmarchaeota archaeon]